MTIHTLSEITEQHIRNTQQTNLTMPHLLCLWAVFLTFLSATLALPQAALPESAIVAFEAIWGSPNSVPRNKTFAVPLDKVWKHMPFAGLERFYLIGAKGNVDVDTIQCSPYWIKPNGQGYAGLWLTTRTPSSPHDIAADLEDASLQLRCSAA